MGCDTAQQVLCNQYNVSIHAPAWGATAEAFNGIGADDVSIHAPAWGATFHHPHLKCLLLFQSTHPHGVRPYTINIGDWVEAFQSTHPHGVRREFFCYNVNYQRFNPRTRMGCDGGGVSRS